MAPCKQYMDVGKTYLLHTLNPEEMLVQCIEVVPEHYKIVLLALSPKPLDTPNPYMGFYLLKRRDQKNSAMLRKAKLVPVEDLPLYLHWPYVTKALYDFFKE